MTPRTPARRRPGFTFVELLIVIAILALLAALLLAGITRVQVVGRVATANSDITQLAGACEKFKQEHGFFPPSSFTIPAQKNSGDFNFQLLAKMYPRWMATQPDGTNTGLVGGGVTLNGNQSLVYFLGGPGNTGWATDAPIAPTAGATAIKGPYFDFKQDRLTPGNQLPAPFTLGNAANVFMDPFRLPSNNGLGTPYAYFASVSPGGKYPATPCWGVSPFVESATNPPLVPNGIVVKYVNMNGVQVISAGEDGKFGPGCPLLGNNPGQVQCVYQAGRSNAAGGVSPYAEGDDGADDVGNVNNGNKLGVGR